MLPKSIQERAAELPKMMNTTTPNFFIDSLSGAV
jgi:hypothetical protein